MTTTDAPILFCHYGATPYLRYSLAAAKATNPARDVVLLGDESNAVFARQAGASFAAWEPLMTAPKVARFQAVYRLVQGSDHEHRRLGRDWVQFVFLRWFLVEEYLKRAGLAGPFWHFDSDTFLAESVNGPEGSMTGLDCSEGCGGQCLNGFVSRRDVVSDYNDHTIGLFQNEEFLKRQRREFAVKTEWAFTEMRAYCEYRSAASLRTRRLGQELNGAVFDECVCQECGLAMHRVGSARAVRRVTLRDGAFLGERVTDGGEVRFWGMNLSWVPLEYFEAAWAHLVPSPGGSRVGDPLTTWFLRFWPASTLAGKAEGLRRVRKARGRVLGVRRLGARQRATAKGAVG